MSSGIPYVRTVPIRHDKKRERDKFYSSTPWMRLRRAFLAINPLCARCLAKGLTVAATIAHHRRERLDYPELALDDRNLEALCDSCHSAEHAHRRNATGGAPSKS